MTKKEFKLVLEFLLDNGSPKNHGKFPATLAVIDRWGLKYGNDGVQLFEIKNIDDMDVDRMWDDYKIFNNS